MKKNEVKVDELGRPTAAQIKEWKAKYGNLHKVTVGGAFDEPIIAIVRQPKLRDLKLANMAGKAKSDIDMLDSLFNNCVLYEDAELRKHDSNYMAAITQMGEIIEIKEAKLEKL